MALAASIYANELNYRGHGLALWDPEPTKAGEVQIGDVGYVDKGSFYRLFNITYPEDHPINQCGVPSEFEILNIDPRHIHKKDNYLPPGPLCSRSVREVAIDIGGSSAKAAGAAYRFRCTEDSGALLVLKDYATLEEVHQGHIFEKYIRKHHANWNAFAKDVCGLSVNPDALMLVKGCVKTSEWAVAAFLDEGTEHEISLCAGAEPYAKANFSVSVSNHNSMSIEYRFGPLPSSKQTFAPFGPPSTDPRPRDQCIFLSAYKLRRRFPLPPKISAAADHARYDGSPPSETEGSVPSADEDTEDFDVYEDPKSPIPRDPLDDVLDYMLQNSDEDVAVASHSDSQEFSSMADDGAKSCHALGCLYGSHDVPKADEASPGTPDDKTPVGYPKVLPTEKRDANDDREGSSNPIIRTQVAVTGSHGARSTPYACQASSSSTYPPGDPYVPNSYGVDFRPAEPSFYPDIIPYIIIPQRIYSANIQRDYTSFMNPIEFWTNGQKGINLAHAQSQLFAGLDHADDRLLDGFAMNVTYRVEWPGYPGFNRQKDLQRTVRGKKSVTCAELARHVAEVLKEFIEAVSLRSTSEAEWRVGPEHIDLSDIYLLELRQVSDTSLQPVLSYRRSDRERRPTPEYPPIQEHAIAVAGSRQSRGGARHPHTQNFGGDMPEGKISDGEDSDEDGRSPVI